VIGLLAYAALLVALVVRLGTRAGPPRETRPLPGEPLWMTRLHHRLFAVLLVGAPVERLLVDSASRGRVAGSVLFAGGVVLYRLAGRTLGDALSPFIEPRPGATLVTDGVYGLLRHPIYVSEAMIALGAPMMLGCRWSLPVAAAALAVLALRIRREEIALAHAFPDYARYAAQTKRLLPFVF
jgi:protein-S-isoprenylcysteine O-methyltransferase Ste14